MTGHTHTHRPRPFESDCREATSLSDMFSS